MHKTVHDKAFCPPCPSAAMEYSNSNSKSAAQTFEKGCEGKEKARNVLPHFLKTKQGNNRIKRSFKIKRKKVKNDKRYRRGEERQRGRQKIVFLRIFIYFLNYTPLHSVLFCSAIQVYIFFLLPSLVKRDQLKRRPPSEGGGDNCIYFNVFPSKTNVYRIHLFNILIGLQLKCLKHLDLWQ